MHVMFFAPMVVLLKKNPMLFKFLVLGGGGGSSANFNGARGFFWVLTPLPGGGDRKHSDPDNPYPLN